MNENVEIEHGGEIGPIDTNTDILMRKVDETTTDICQVKRQSARLSLHNTLEIVPENEPIETKHTEPNKNNEKDEINEIIEKLKKCNDLESLKCAYINKTLVEMKASLAENNTNDKYHSSNISAPSNPQWPQQLALLLEQSI